MLLRHFFNIKSNKSAILKNFFGKSNKYEISRGFFEIPRPAPLLALGGFDLKIYPMFLIQTILFMHHLFKIPINFVMHSWDIIYIPNSITSKICSKEKFEKKLDLLIKKIKKNYKFERLIDIYEDP